MRHDDDMAVEQLHYPATLPDDCLGYETMRVIEDHSIKNECVIHVELGDCFDSFYSWGVYLCEIARAMAKQHAEVLDVRRDGGDAFLDICDGFRNNFF
jgi:hypothetical protein